MPFLILQVNFIQVMTLMIGVSLRDSHFNCPRMPVSADSSSKYNTTRRPTRTRKQPPWMKTGDWVVVKQHVFKAVPDEVVYVRVERTGTLVKPRTLDRKVPGSSPPVAVRCGLEQVTYLQLLMKC